MMRHATTRRLLHDFVLGELSPRRRAAMENHIQTCRSCAADVLEIQETSTLLTDKRRLPSDERSAEFWAGFADTVNRRIAERARTSRPTGPAFDLRSVLRLARWRPLLAGAAASAALFAAFILALQPKDTHLSVVTGIPESATAPSMSADTLMEQYLRKSRSLLVGLANMDTEGGHPLDLSAERRTSRELIREARYIKQQPLDHRSARLISDLDKIMVQVANFAPDRPTPDVELVRGGIRHENLLFKVRMAQQRYTAPPIEEQP
jgi:hypothetical protein